MPKYIVEVFWSVGGSVVIEAENEQEATDKAETLELEEFDSEYINDSFVINNVEEEEEEE